MNKRTWIERATKRASIIVMCAASAMVLQACGEGSEADVVRDGLDGKDGLPGLVGANGKDGKDGLPGATGKDGPTGPTGPAGMDGRDGLHGSDGLDGQNGQDGVDGKDGLSGPMGLAGKDGKDGLPGPAGSAGKDGKNGLPGGPQGARGLDGFSGIPGERGEQGPPGRDGLDAGRVLDRAFQHSSAYAEQCAPENAEAQTHLGSLTSEKHWVRSMMDEAYLWRQDVPYVNADLPEYGGSDGSTALSAYFDALRSPAFQPSGKRRDEYSQVVPTSAFNDFISGGEVPGFGIEWAVESSTPPRRIRVAYVQPGSDAARSGVKRGYMLDYGGEGVVDVDAVGEVGAASLAASLFPRQKGARRAFGFSPTDEGGTLITALSSGFVRQSVPLAKVIDGPEGAVGYLLFQEHNAKATDRLVEEIWSFKDQKISSLVIDLRFNQGGDLSVASQLAYMIAGDEHRAGQVFARFRGNQPGQEKTMPFHGCLAAGSECSVDERLPTLNFFRVYVLTQAGTCGASEALISGLRGLGVQVVQIGSATCGRPYATHPVVNCGHTFLPLDQLMSNDRGFSGSGEGFVPGGSSPNGLPGCRVVDDLKHELGDPAEALLAAALQHMSTESCPAQDGEDSPSVAPRAPWRDLLRGGAFIMPTR